MLAVDLVGARKRQLLQEKHAPRVLVGRAVRERELLAALADGWSNLQIASRIGISRNTVKYHLKNLYDKLNVNNRAMAVALFMTQQSQRELR